jgi:hypothetical protein
MSAKRAREASDPENWCRRLTALARLLEAVENHEIDWRKSRHIKKAWEEIEAIPHPEFEISMGVQMAAGWLAHLIRAIALDEKANLGLGQMQFIINVVRELMKNAGYVLAAQQIIESRGVDELNALKRSNKDRTRPATLKKRNISAQIDKIIMTRASKYRTDDGWERGTPSKIKPVVNKDIGRLNGEMLVAHESEMAKFPQKKRKDFVRIEELGADAISRRLNRMIARPSEKQ